MSGESFKCFSWSLEEQVDQRNIVVLLGGGEGPCEVGCHEFITMLICPSRVWDYPAEISCSRAA